MSLILSFKCIMESNDHGLIGFLERKSLFGKQSSKSAKKRSGSRSNDHKQSVVRKINFNQAAVNTSSRFTIKQDSSFLNQTHASSTTNAPEDNNMQRFSSFGNMPSSPYGQQLPQSRFIESKVKTFRQESEAEHSFPWKNQQRQTNWKDFSCSSVGFESARLEASHCLDILSLNLKTELSHANYRIDEFRKHMARILHQELNTMKQKIVMMVEEAFKESEKGIKQYMKLEEQRLAGDFLSLRNRLQRQYIRIEDLREEIDRPQWRKAAGEILSTDIERRISDLIEESSSAPIGRWEGKEWWSHQKMMNLATELRDVVRFRE